MPYLSPIGMDMAMIFVAQTILLDLVQRFGITKKILRAGRNSPPAVRETPSPRALSDEVSRSGAIPEPTVIVRMKEKTQCTDYDRCLVV